VTRPTLLVTGGLGFIGSHAVVALAAAGYDVAILDNLANCKRSVLDRVNRLVGRALPFHEADIRDAAALERVFRAQDIGAVMHFAGLKAVGESVAQPLRYYDNNVRGSLCLLETMARHGAKTIVFSSSCTVYGEPEQVPIREDAPLRSATNPYGRTKQVVEDMLRDLGRADPSWRIALLRYFNPVGAHESGTIGEDPAGEPNNLMPYVSQVAIGQRGEVRVFGNDYPTHDGTGIRDYIHVCDLADGHVAAMRHVEREPGILTVNLGTGGGYSVLEMIAAFERACGRPIPYRIHPRRPGDIAATYADVTRATSVLGWRAQRGLDAICTDAWRWQQWAAANL
jgi:UDP-glucose 4-epimerase